MHKHLIQRILGSLVLATFVLIIVSLFKKDIQTFHTIQVHNIEARQASAKPHTLHASLLLLLPQHATINQEDSLYPHYEEAFILPLMYVTKPSPTIKAPDKVTPKWIKQLLAARNLIPVSIALFSLFILKS